MKSYGQLQRDPPIAWSLTQARSAKDAGYSLQANKSQGFLARHFRSFSNSLPQFSSSSELHANNKLRAVRDRGGNWVHRIRIVVVVIIRQIWRFKLQVSVLLLLCFGVLLFYATPLNSMYKRAAFLGGGSKFVVILAANEGGGVMEWKGPREWAIERDSVRNKRKYVKRWGYDLEIVDMATKKRYAHEWRESWEKVDTIRRCLKEYPHAEWFWWLDLHTFIMEPSYSLQSHVFDSLAKNTYRDINQYNPLNITHPLTADYLDDLSRSRDGDGQAESINMVVPQDCSGFNMGSFFIRRSPWTDRLLDMWWDPVHYEQRHMQWEHKEQDAFEYLYQSQAWIRPHTAFIQQRKICSFPPGACGQGNSSIHYHKDDRDFVVNMAGCEWGRDCWGEMYNFRETSNYLNRTLWEKFKDGLRDAFKYLINNLRSSNNAV